MFTNNNHLKLLLYQNVRIFCLGKVPILDTGSKKIVESLDICDYLNQEYPNPPLYPAEPLALKKDKDLIDKISPLTTVFTDILLKKEEKLPSQWREALLPHLLVFENELKQRGTPYFGGDSPAMVNIFPGISLDKFVIIICF